MNKHKCLLITTGGTISGNIHSDRTHKTVKSSSELDNLLSPAITDIAQDYNIEVMVTQYWNETNKKDEIDEDSSDINPEHWKKLANIIYEEYDNYESFIISHGTNTLGYTSAALTFSLSNINKPVILTGSQVPAGSGGSDAEMNLNNAIRVATYPNQNNGGAINGVYVVFGSHIISGIRVKKDTAFDYDAFKSFNTGSIGRIGRIIDIDEHNLTEYKKHLGKKNVGFARVQKILELKNDFDLNIASLTEFPGMNSDIFRNLVNSGIKAFIIRAFGAGDISSKHWKVIKELKEKEIPLIVTTQAPNGNSNMQVNEPGKYLKDNALAIPAYDMGIESMTVKLSWLLAQEGITYREICHQMTQNLHGEINVIVEV